MDRAGKMCWMFIACTSVFAITLALLPSGSFAQQSAGERMSSVTEDYSFEVLLPAMSPEDLASIRNVANWCVSMARSSQVRAEQIKIQIDPQSEAKKAEIKALEARAKAAGAAKDEVLKKQLEASVKEQKLQSDILDAVKKLSENEASIAGEYESAGKALESLTSSYESLANGRESVLKNHEKAVEAAKQAGLTPPALLIDYEMNNQALKSLGEAGSKIKGLGEKMDNLAKARQELVNNWKKLSEARAKM